MECISKVIQGNPDEEHISTSYIERQNLTMRMAMRRFTRLTNAFSKKLDNLKFAVALHFAFFAGQIRTVLDVNPPYPASQGRVSGVPATQSQDTTRFLVLA
jgi:hypothetical protein